MKVKMVHPDLVLDKPVEVDERAYEKVWKDKGWLLESDNEEGTGGMPPEAEMEPSDDDVAEGSDEVLDEEEDGE